MTSTEFKEFVETRRTAEAAGNAPAPFRRQVPERPAHAPSHVSQAGLHTALDGFLSRLEVAVGVSEIQQARRLA